MLIIIVTMLVFTLISIYAIRHSSKNAYILDKKLNGVVAGLSAGATTNSGFAFIAAVGVGYTIGLSALVLPFASMIGHIIFWTFVADKVVEKSHQGTALSLPEMVINGVSKNIKLNDLFLKCMAGLICAGLMLFLMGQFASVEKTVIGFTDLPPIIPMLTILFFVVIYSSIGGFIASVYTDVVQAIIMLLLVVGVLIWSLLKLDVGFADISISNSELLLWTGKGTVESTLLVAVSFVVLAFAFAMSQPQVATRLMAVKDRSQLKTAKIIYIFFIVFTWAGMSFVGFLLRFILEGVEDPEMALMQVAQQNFHPVIIVCVMVGVLSAVISTLDTVS